MTLLLLSSTIALASFRPNVRIDHKLPNHSCINVAIAVGPGAPSDQPIYVTFEDDSMVGIFNALSDVMFQKSTDAGRTWLPTDVLVRDGDPHAYEPDITTDSEGNVYIVWEDWYVDTAGGHEHRILCSRSSDGGTTWAAPARVDDRPDPTKWFITRPSIAADSAGNAFCAWEDTRTGSSHIWSSVSTDRGATWRLNVQVDDDTTDEGVGRAEVVVQPGTNHYLVAAQTPRRVGSHWESGTALYRSTDMGLTFQPGVQIDTSRYDTRHPHIAADRDHIICDYFADPYRVGETLFVEARTFYTQGDSWGTPAPMTDLDPDHELYYSGEFAISGDGRVHTALMVRDTFDGEYNIHYTCSSDHGVSWSDLDLVSDDITVECWYPDIAADSAGHAYIVWYEPNASHGEVWFATNAPAAIAEETSNADLRATNSGPTVVRGVLFLPGATSPKPQAISLMDIEGRKVLDLKPGANSVRALSPGMYFVREAQAQARAVRKVVVTR